MKDRVQTSGKTPVSLWEASDFEFFPLCHLVQPILPWHQNLLSGITDTNKLK